MGRVPIARAGLCVLSHLQWVVCLGGSRILVEAGAGIHGFREMSLNQPACLCRAVENLDDPPWASILLGKESEFGVGISPGVLRERCF